MGTAWKQSDAREPRGWVVAGSKNPFQKPAFAQGCVSSLPPYGHRLYPSPPACWATVTVHRLRAGSPLHLHFFFVLSTLNSLPFSLTYARSLRPYEHNNNNNNNNAFLNNEQLVKIKTLTDNLKSEDGEGNVKSQPGGKPIARSISSDTYMYNCTSKNQKTHNQGLSKSKSNISFPFLPPREHCSARKKKKEACDH